MRTFTLLTLLLLAINGHAQLETKNWFLYGNRIAVTPTGVTTGLPTPASFNVGYKSASVSDASGNLLLAFDGNKIIDRNMNVMPALANINLLATSSKMMIQQVPGTSRYYVFYASKTTFPDYANSKWKLKYALVDLSLNGGSGDVVSYDQVIDTSSSPAFSLVQGEDASKAWLVTHRWATDSFFVYPITNTGLGTTAMISKAGTNATIPDYIFRDLKTSYDGKMIAGIAYRDYSNIFATTYGFTEVFTFDATTGSLTSKVRTRRKFGYFVGYFSLEFSPNNRLLYECLVTRVNGLQPCGFASGSVRQYNLCYTDSIEFDRISVLVAQNFVSCYYYVSWGNIQMGADKRIHMPYTGTNVSTINFPNRIGTQATYVFNSYQLPTQNFGSVAAPDFHHKLMEKAIKNNIVYESGCYPNPVTFKITNDTVHTVQWNFGDPGSADNTSSLQSPTHVFSAPGIYTITAQLFNTQGTEIETVSEVVEVKDPGKRLLSSYPADTTFCEGGSMTIKLSVVNGIYRWYRIVNGIEGNYDVSDSFKIQSSGTWYVEMRQNDCNGCRKVDSIKVTVLPKPYVGLGPDRNLCSGDSLLLSFNDPAANYIWNTGATSSSIRVYQGGLYWIEADYNHNGCPVRDSIVLTSVPGIQFALPPDTLLCNNQSLLLQTGIQNASHLWQNGSSQPQLQVTQPGTYWVRVIATNGCVKADTIKVTFVNAQQVHLGNDTVLCYGNSLPLQTNVSSAQYLWSTGQITPSISVAESGAYWVRVNNGACTIADTVNVTFDLPPVVFLGNDTTICPQRQLVLSPAISNGQYTWQDGSHAAFNNVTQPGSFWVDVKQGGCTVRDTINVQFYTVPAMQLGADARFCAGDSLRLNASVGFMQYLWNTGSTAASIVVRDDGNYIVTGKTADGCTATDTLKILSPYPLPVVNLGPDADLCLGTSKMLNAGAGFSQYAWSNGSNASSINVNAIGWYSVTVRDQQGCKNADTVRILSILSLPSGFLPSDTAICSYGDMLLKPVQSFARYTWSNGSAGPSLVINQPGTFWLEVEDNKQCRGRDSVLVQQKDCLQGFLIPTAFSPNGDGNNDDFKPLIFGRIEQYSFSVYNRWGQVVFHSNTPGQAWSGNHGSRSQDTSIFVWVCHYKLQNENQKTARGTVLLVR